MPATTPRPDYLFKVVLIGDSCVGKASLMRRFADDTYKDNHPRIVGWDLRLSEMEVDGSSIRLQIWFKPGQERYGSLLSLYYRHADGAIIVYDVTNRRTFDNVSGWIEEIERYASAPVSKLLVGNKCDVGGAGRAVDYAAAEEFAARVHLPYVETSARDGTNVDGAFTTVAAHIMRRVGVAPAAAHDQSNATSSTRKPTSNAGASSRRPAPTSHTRSRPI